MITFTSIVYTIILLILQRVSGDSVLNRKCYDLGNQTGILFSAEICKNLVKDCFRDGIILHSIDQQLYRKKFSEVLFWSQCSMKFDTGCLQTCKTHGLQEQQVCNLWKTDNEPLARNFCQQQLAMNYVNNQCEIDCFKITKQAETQLLYGNSQVEHLEKYLHNFEPTELMWLLE